MAPVNPSKSVLKTVTSLLPAAAIATCSFAALDSVTGPSKSVSTGSLTIQVIGLRNDKGVLRGALFNSASAWSADKSNTGNGAVQRQVVPINGGTATITFNNIPYGTYAFKAFHDEDMSGRFYTGMFGIPKVGVAFSNNVSIRQGPASFGQASFALNQSYTNLVLTAQRF